MGSGWVMGWAGMGGGGGGRGHYDGGKNRVCEKTNGRGAVMIAKEAK